MPSPTTALQIIEDALALSNAVGVDQTLTNKETSDSLRKLNDLIELWGTKQLAVFGQANQTFNTIANQKVYTIGAGGDWNTVRPVRIHEPGYTTYQSVTFPLVATTQQEYNLIGYKDQTQEMASVYLYVNAYPLGIITLWPVPTMALPVTLTIDRILTQISSAAASISFPPGYVDTFVNMLAVRLAPLFGKQAPQDVKDQARDSFASICKANYKAPILNYDVALTGNYWYGDWRYGP